MRTTPIFVALAAVLLHCATLNPVAADVCGNGVVESGEDCDSTDATKCGAPTSDAEHACHLLCSDTAACAPGSSCSADGICRRPAGTFAAATAGVSGNVTSLLAGDFDGDKHTDVVGLPPYGSAGSSRVHYFDANGALATTTALDLPIPLATVKDLDRDGVDDIGFAIRTLGFGAFGALSGQRDRSFATVLYPAVTFAGNDAKWTVVTNRTNVKLPGTTPSCAFGLLSGAVSLTESATRVISLCDGPTGQAGAFNLQVGFGPNDLVGEPWSGLIDKAASSCGQLVFATSSAVNILPLCQGESWLDGPGAAPRRVAVPEPITAAFVGPILGGDTDDIIVRAQSGRTYLYDKLAFAFVEASGSLANAATLPLASGDLNGDKAVDFVYPNGIVLAAPVVVPGDGGAGTTVGTPTRIPPRDQLTWSSARIGRFNDDDLPDVLVSFDGQLDVDVLGNSGDGRFTPFTIRTDQPVRGIGSGDFDGDRIDDVAFLQSDDPTDNGPAQLFIAFGSATGAPETAHLVGTLKNAHALVTLKDGTIGVDDLSVVGTAPPQSNPSPNTPAGDEASVTVLFGTGGRTQVAPLFMQDGSSSATGADAGAGGGRDGGAGSTPVGTTGGGVGGNRTGPDEAAHYWQPASFSIGPFVTAKTLQIVSLAVGYDYVPNPPKGQLQYQNLETAAWFAAEDDSALGNLQPFTFAQPLDPLVTYDPTALLQNKVELTMVTASGDIDAPVAAGEEVDELVTVTKATVAPNVAAVYVVRPGQVTRAVLAAAIPNAKVVGSDPIAIVDVDGDHAPDVAFIITVEGARRLMVLRGDGKGNFQAPTALAVPNDAVTFAPIDTGKAHLELAVATPKKVLLASLERVTELSTGVDAPSFTGLTVGDFNGDGVEDIALADSGSIRLMPQSYVVNGRRP